MYFFRKCSVAKISLYRSSSHDNEININGEQAHLYLQLRIVKIHVYFFF